MRPSWKSCTHSDETHPLTIVDLNAQGTHAFPQCKVEKNKVSIVKLIPLVYDVCFKASMAEIGEVCMKESEGEYEDLISMEGN